ncbi:hypothetical protein SCLARK_00462 [Spiroplasma clarkii]|uniref:hypothetical protein n=1 Tax=Spiroplasma clarkii TaxID=2139 RepID=UPI000B55EFFA|nr:hypothetical protein [Spiroplasma clarkii]ARU91176.1 hypothetical protein SCLARK_00462 [Spiroplasma clarkii]
MLYTRKISDIFTEPNPIALVSLGLFVLALCLFVYFIIKASRIIKLNKYVKSIILDIHVVYNSPIKLMLRQSIKGLATKPQFEKKVRVWNFWIYRTYTIVYNNLVTRFTDLLDTTKPFSVTAKNLKGYKNLAIKFEILKKEIEIIYLEMFDFSQEEMLLRDYIIFLKSSFDDLKEESFIFVVQQKGIQLQKMEEALKKPKCALNSIIMQLKRQILKML